MKKLITIMLVAIVPFITMAQKRGKKNDSSNKYEFMIIKGVEINYDQIDRRESLSDKSARDVVSHEKIEYLIKGDSKLIISFDSGESAGEDIVELTKSSQRIRTMAAAVNMAASYGWEFINSTVIDKDIALIHYYYMKRKE